MLMSGADKNKVELRPPSFKGMLRFWWRALHGNLSLEELRKNEGIIFGASDENIGKSPFSIRIHKPNIWDGNQEVLFTHSESKKFKYPALKEDQSFEINFSSRNKEIEEKVKNLFEISSILGGFGKRSRRGYGSIEILRIIELQDIKDTNSAKNIQFSIPTEPNKILDKILELINSINAGMYIKNTDKGAMKIIKKFPSPILSQLNKYPFIEEIEIGEGHSQAKEILKTIGKASHDHDCEYTGFAKGNIRFASPIYVSIIKACLLYTSPSPRDS